jgi:hypothetical protein
MALKMLGVTMVPCMIFPDKEAYTYDRMVNPLSPVQERRMLLKSLQTIDRATIAEVFGVKSIAYRLAENVVKHLAPEVVKGVDQHLLTLRCAAEMTYVKVERQLEILAAMKERGDYSTACARTLVAQTTPSLRNPAKASRRVWTRRSEAKKALVTKLQEASKQYDFYTKSYHEYATDLLKLCSYVRKLVKNTKLRDYLEEKFPELLERFEEIIFDMKGV